MRPGDLVRLKNEFDHDMEFGVSMLPSPVYWGSAIGYFEGTHVGILLDCRDGDGETLEHESSLVLVGDCVGWVDTIDLEVVP
jgi:hypothetical protein